MPQPMDYRSALGSAGLQWRRRAKGRLNRLKEVASSSALAQLLAAKYAQVEDPVPVVQGDPLQRGKELHARVPADRWCITQEDLRQFLAEVRERHARGEIPNEPDPKTGLLNPHHDDSQIGPNIHMVNRHVISPVTAATGGMSWSLMLHEDGLPIDFFVTHNWQEGAYEFCLRVLESWPPGTHHMWCCFLANPQAWKKEDLKLLLGSQPDLSDSPFTRALNGATCQMLLVVPNATESIYKRLWCVEEARRAIERGLPVWLATDCGILHWPSRCKSVADASRMMASNTLLRTKAWSPEDCEAQERSVQQLAHDFETVTNAQCSDEDDRRRILASIMGEEARINTMICQLAKSGKWMPARQRDPEKPTTQRLLRRYTESPLYRSDSKFIDEGEVHRTASVGPATL